MSRYRDIDNSLFIANRAYLVSELQPGSMVVLQSDAQGEYGVYVCNKNLFYLSGVDQECTALIIYVDECCVANEVLFIKENTEHTQLWEGNILSISEAYRVSGIKDIRYITQYDITMKHYAVKAHSIYTDTYTSARLLGLLEQMQLEYKFADLDLLLSKMRIYKSDDEVNLISYACGITGSGITDVLPKIKPGMFEFQIEAELTRSFMYGGSRYMSFPPIVASGCNACKLHYGNNDSLCRDGEMVLMDVGAEYANYCSDITRTVPVNGRFSSRQREVYGAVLSIMDKTAQMIHVGMTFAEYNNAIVDIVEETLVDLRLLLYDEVGSGVYKKYFPHGISHHLGLDVHDKSDYSTPIAENMVITIEPGIYIRDEGLGIRLESDFLVKEIGVVNLCSDVPILVDEIEQLMFR